MESPEQTELRRLADTYDLHEEIRREPSTVTWLGRHRPLGRDVTVTVYRAGPHIGPDELTHLAADARLLSGARRDGVVPVVESRWLSHEALAIVRPRVRGTTLREVIRQSGPLDAPHAAEVLQQVGASLEWARRQGIVHRTLSPDTVCVHEGSGRVLLSFAAAPSPDGDAASSWRGGADVAGAVLDRCSDVRTIGALGWELLTGRAPAAGDSLQALRPDVSPELVRIVEESRTCDRMGRAAELSAVVAGLGTLGLGTGVPASARVTTAQPSPWPAMDAVPSVPPDAMAPPPPATGWTPAPASPPDRPRGRQLATAGIGLALLGAIIFFFVMSGRDDAGRDDSATRSARATTGAPAGRIGARADSATMSGEVAIGGDELVTGAAAGRAAVRAPAATGAAAAPVRSAQAPPATGAPGLAACSSPAPADQRTCLAAHLARTDVDLNRAYLELISQLRQQAGPDAGAEPPAVQQLRAEQREWLVRRDAECVRQSGNEGALWAPARASCLGQISQRRAGELWARVERARRG